MHIDLSPEELAFRDAEGEAKTAAAAKRWSWVMSRSLGPVVSALQRRYPGVRIAEATIEHSNDFAQQSITYEAPLDRLAEWGLLTTRMVRDKDRWVSDLLAGDGYSFFTSDQTPLVRLSVYTGTSPRERERFSVKDAERELRRFRLRKRPAPNV